MSEPTFIIFTIPSDTELIEMAKCLVNCSVKINTRADGLLRILTNVIDSALDDCAPESLLHDEEFDEELGSTVPELVAEDVLFISGFSKSEISAAIVHFTNLAKAARIRTPSTKIQDPLYRYAVLPLYEQMLEILDTHLANGAQLH